MRFLLGAMLSVIAAVIFFFLMWLRDLSGAWFFVAAMAIVVIIGVTVGVLEDRGYITND